MREPRKAFMVAAHKASLPAPPPSRVEPIINGTPQLQHWFMHYWQKLQLPTQELSRLAITQDRREFMRWTGKRLNIMVLGCYCYLPAPVVSRTRSSKKKAAQARSGSDTTSALHLDTLEHRHLIFVEPDMQPKSIEVTIAHELIHLADRVHGTPRRHRHHGYDSIAVDEAAVTGYPVDELRQLLHEESSKRERLRRERRPIRYFYECPQCGKEYPRARLYSQAVSCSSCDKSYNPLFRLRLRNNDEKPFTENEPESPTLKHRD
jgi:predicted SprT family Zn-dependent metalloprotease